MADGTSVGIGYIHRFKFCCMFEQERQDALGLLSLLILHRWRFTAALFAGIIIALVLFILIPSRYRSYATVYPYNSFARDQLVSNPQFGHEVDSDRLLQILESNDIRSSICKEFNLVRYYDIDTARFDWEDKLAEYFYRDISFTRTRYLSVNIMAEMEDPELSRTVVNRIIELTNDFQAKVYTQNIRKEVEYLQSNLAQQQLRVDSIEKQIYALKKPDQPMHILYNHLLAAGKEQPKPEVFQFVDSPELEKLVEDYKFEYSKLLSLRDQARNIENQSRRPVPNLYIVDHPRASHKRIYPRLTILLPICTVSALVITLVILLLSDQISKIKKSLPKS